MVKFKKLTEKSFSKKYSECEELTDRATLYGLGEVKIPGYGWHACTLNEKGFPALFWDDDDGWQDCPRASFEELV